MNRERPVLVAPDKFKETLSAQEAATAIGRGLVAGGIEPIELLPVADGGEGTMEALVRAGGGQVASLTATDPLGRPVTAAFGLIDDGATAIVETAQASGLWRLSPEERDAWAASTRGTGELIAAAAEAGARKIIVSAGGSATTDGGRGALEALGASFTANGADLAALRRRLHGIKLLVACDVRSPMCGAEGAARTFAPQKDADPSTVNALEQRLRSWARLARTATKHDPYSEPMAGAAGGLAGGLWAFAGARLEPGAALVLEAIDFDARLAEARYVVTGEGTLDAQTLEGKALLEVATRARQTGVPCYAVVGQDRLDDFGKRLLDVEVEAAAPKGQTASVTELERAARTLARRL